MDTLGEAVVTRLRLNTGGWVAHEFGGIPKQQGFITIQNGSPGLQALQVSVNKTAYELTLADNQIATIDASASMVGGGKGNTISLQGYGVLGADAVVVIGQRNQPQVPLPDGWQSSASRENWVWGNQTNVVEKMSKGCVASSLDQTVKVAFDGKLSASSANDPSHYSIDIGTTDSTSTMSPVSAWYDSSARTVTLTLPAGTLQPGNQVTVYWDDLVTSGRRELHGCTQPMTAQ